LANANRSLHKQLYEHSIWQTLTYVYRQYYEHEAKLHYLNYLFVINTSISYINV